MNSRKLKRFILLMLCACMAVSVIPDTGAAQPSDEDDTGADSSLGSTRSAPDTSSCAVQNGFAVELLKGNYADGDNVCVAPLSLYSALAMTQNGAGGATLEQLGDLLGG